MTKSNITLDTDVRYVKGVGPVRATQLAQLGIETVKDLLMHFPFRFDLRRQVQPIETLEVNDQPASIAGEVMAVSENKRGRTPWFQCQLQDNTGYVMLKWFHGGYLRDKIKVGMQLAANAKVTTYKESLQMINPQFQVLWDPEGTDLDRDQLLPVYPAGAKLTSPMIGAIIRKVLPQADHLVERWFDAEYLEKRGLMSRPAAVPAMHYPEDTDHWGMARRRMAYDECILMQLAIAIMRNRQVSRPAHSLKNTPLIDSRIRARFDFELTGGQNKAVEEICKDLARTNPMNRLVQGDVGCGKTVVALYAALVAVANGKQAAIMAPTEILARQHYQKILKYLDGSRVRTALLTGSLKQSQRNEILQKCTNGEVDIIVGTHALLSDKLNMPNLGLVTVDEQHKFGVQQRTAFRGKGFAPHYLVMTATPIPRTLAMTVFGDLDVSIIDELPPGRGKTVTEFKRTHQFDEILQTVREKLDAGQQAYFIYPLVNPSAELELTAAQEAYDDLSSGALSDYTITMLHGQMDAARKNKAMEDFRSGKARVLVASVVVEVGVDVAAANVMVINHAERFGLAQLHQLRGRVGRSTQDALCLLVGDPANPVAAERMDVLVKYDDGFKVAEEDLRLRGPGEIFGTKQHGLPELKVADLVEDFELLRLARRDAFGIIREDPSLQAPHYQKLRAELIKIYAGRFQLLDGA